MNFEATETFGSTTADSGADSAADLALRRTRVVVFSPNAPAQSIPLDGDATFGRSDRCDVAVADGRVSRLHIIVERDAATGRFVARDNSSKNGAWINGRPLRTHRLHSNDVLRFGDTLAVFEADVGPAQIGDASLSGPIGHIHTQINVAAIDERPVLLLGPTGAGKSWFAHQLAERSASTPYVEVNCGALQPSLVDSELFGHASGAFTGARATRTGLIESADGGTLFLDEIGTIGLDVQARLLTCIERQRIRRVGENRERDVRVRFIAATNLDVDQAVEAGTFRADLKFRLAGHTIAIPPLRDRRVDTLHRALEMVPRDAWSAEALETLALYRWPGNVRELQNVVRSVAARRTGRLERVDLPPEFRAPAPTESSPDHPAHARRPTPEELAAALAAHRGNVAATARSFDTHRTQVARWCSYMNIDPNAYRG